MLKDEIGVSALKAAVPAGVHLSILTVDNAAVRLNAGIYSGQRVFLIVNKTRTIQRLIENGLKVKEVNIGNMGEKEGRQRIKKSVYCTLEELSHIEAVEKASVTVYAQMVPNDEKKHSVPIFIKQKEVKTIWKYKHGKLLHLQFYH